MSYAKNLFEGVAPKHVNKSRFNLSHEWKDSINYGKIIPILLEPTMPGDEFTISSEFMFRFLPQEYPVMHMCSLYCNYFWIPNRILWRTTQHAAEGGDGWINFITMTTEMLPPVVEIDNQLLTDPAANDTVMGFMKFPYYRSAVGWKDRITGINALPLSAYLAVWDEYYRNPQIEPGKWFNLQSGDNSTLFNSVFETNDYRYRVFSSKWEKDYLTSATPTPQAGDPVLIPSLGIDDETGLFDIQNIKKLDGTTPVDGSLTSVAGELKRSTDHVVLESTATIRQLRLAEALQTFKERILKVGQRYTDYIKGLFGNHPTPGSVDVPVWFGYYRGKVQITDVLTQAETLVGETEYRTGQYTGRMDLYEKGDTFKLYCAEHGWVMALLELKPNTSYGQGVDRWWRYELPTDYPLDIFAGIGDQEILKEEVVLMTEDTIYNAGGNQETFGYIPRYSEMRYRNGHFGGNLQKQAGLSQHFGRMWSTELLTGSAWDNLEINQEFINMWSADPLQQRPYKGGLREEDIFTSLPLFPNEIGENSVFCHIFHSIFVNRNLPMFSTPKLGQ